MDHLYSTVGSCIVASQDGPRKPGSIAFARGKILTICENGTVVETVLCGIHRYIKILYFYISVVIDLIPRTKIVYLSPCLILSISSVDYIIYLYYIQRNILLTCTDHQFLLLFQSTLSFYDNSLKILQNNLFQGL